MYLYGGRHFVLNSLCAIQVGKLLDIENEKILEGIKQFKLTNKRMDITKLKNGVTIINDSYNASFESMQASLKNLAEHKNNRKIAVLGDMFELGEFSEELHRKVGKEVINNKIDVLICIGKNARKIYEEAYSDGKKENIYYFEDKEEVTELLNKIIKKEDVILFKASNGMRLFDLVDEFKKQYE